MRLVLSAQSTPSGSGALRCVSDFPRRQTYSLFTGKPNFSFGQKTHRKDPIAFHYKVLHGTSEEPKYGLALAQLAALPADVLSVATSPSLPFLPSFTWTSPPVTPPYRDWFHRWCPTDISDRLSAAEAAGRAASLSSQITRRRKVLLEFKEKLVHALQSDLDDEEWRKYLVFLQTEGVSELMAIEEAADRTIEES
jgi:hypothetical protein